MATQEWDWSQSFSEILSAVDISAPSPSSPYVYLNSSSSSSSTSSISLSPASPMWRRRKKTVALCSFDGGGSRGVMELVMADVVFKVATVILRNPNEMPRFVKHKHTNYDTYKHRHNHTVIHPSAMPRLVMHM